MHKAVRFGISPAAAGGWLLALLAWTFVLRLPFFFHDHFSMDEGLYVTIANRMLQGARLYTDLWDNKPVGIYLIYGTLLFLSGGSITAIIMGSAVAIAATAFLLGMIGWRMFGSKRAGVIMAFLFPPYMLDMGADGANAENFFVPFTVLSVLVLGTYFVTAADKRSLVRTGLAFGLILGLALQIKFLILFETAALGLTFAFLLWRRNANVADLAKLLASFLVAFLLPTLLVMAWFAVHGRLDALLFSNFISPRLYVEHPFGLARPLHLLEMTIRKASYFAPLMLIAALVFGRKLSKRPFFPMEGIEPFALVSAWLFGAYLGAISTGQDSYHYFIVLAAPLCVLAGLAADAVLARMGGENWKTAAVLALLMTWPLYFHVTKTWKRAHAGIPRPDWAMADEIRRHAPPDTPILVIGQSPMLYPLSGMVPATRYPFAWHITDRPRAYGVDAPAELERIFARRPALVATSAHWGRDRDDEIGRRIQRHLAQDYVPIALEPRWNGLLELFHLRDERLPVQAAHHGGISGDPVP